VTALEPAVSPRRFADRRAAGRALAERLSGAAPEDLVVLGLPRGGVVVAAEVAAVLGVPLDVLVVRKLGLPWQPELAMGAIAAVGDSVETVRVETVLAAAQVGAETFEFVRQQELTELRRREVAYRDGRPAVPVAGRAVVVVDDGLATGATMRAAVAAVRRQRPTRVTAAVPVGSPTACAATGAEVDELVCLSAPQSFRAVGQAYADFAATTDEEVRTALDRARSASS
jgi:putative phosphoribosyl transferase